MEVISYTVLSGSNIHGMVVVAFINETSEMKCGGEVRLSDHVIASAIFKIHVQGHMFNFPLSQRNGSTKIPDPDLQSIKTRNFFIL